MMDGSGVRGRSQKQWVDYVREDLHLNLKFCRALNYMVEEIPRQGRLEGCHRMSAATQLICGLESV